MIRFLQFLVEFLKKLLAYFKTEEPSPEPVLRVGASFHIQYTGDMDWNRSVDVYNVDAFDTSKARVEALKTRGVYPIAYLSLGTAENWRPDFSEFRPEDLGEEMQDWPGEYYVNPNSSNVRRVMAARLDMIKRKGFLGVDPDNVDGYYATEFPVGDYRNYLLWFAGECKSRGLACGLKNGQDMITPELVEATAFHTVESCVVYNECNASNAFLSVGKPVFNIEYEENHGGDYSFVASLREAGHSVVIKTYDLGAWEVLG